MVFSNRLMRSLERLSKKRALSIARQQFTRKQAYLPQTKDFTIYDNLPGNCCVYMAAPLRKSCWFVLCPREEAPEGSILGSSRLIVISKLSGKVVYDKPANDEG